LLLALAGAASMLARSTGAQPADTLHACTYPSAQQLAACTALIEANDQLPAVRGLAYVMRGNFHRDFRGDIDRAMADYAAALALNPSDLLAYGTRGDTFRAVGDFDHAIADYDRLFAMMRADGLGLDDPVVAFVFRNRAEAYLAKGDAARAVADYDAAIRILPREARSLHGRGLAKARQGDRAGSEADMALARAIRPDIAAELATSGLE